MVSVRTMGEFLDRIVFLYDKAKRLSRNVDKRVVRGRAKCIASRTEEMFADFVCQSVLRKKKGFKVLVDFPITIAGLNGPKRPAMSILLLLKRRPVMAMRFCTWLN